MHVINSETSHLAIFIFRKTLFAIPYLNFYFDKVLILTLLMEEGNKSGSNTVKQFGFIAGPVVFLSILFLVSPNLISPGANKVLAVAAWMIVWWISEAAPVPIAALLPLILFPFLGVMKMSEAAAPYANPIIFLFMGGFMLALGLEKHRLHERIALNLIKITGTSGNGIILGFLIATGFISMWISNTATAMMMLPIAVSVIKLLSTEKGNTPETTSIGERNFGIGVMLGNCLCRQYWRGGDNYWYSA
jgi:sodium-dependent dicarboxylate transporter 2/3/5